MMVRVLIGGDVPSAAEVQRVLSDLDFDLSLLDLEARFEDSRGFFPMRAKFGNDHTDTGVEIYVGPADALPKSSKLAVHPQFSEAIDFRWSSSHDECFCALAVSAAIASLTKGVILADWLDSFASAEEMIAEARTARDTVIGMQASAQERAEWPQRFLAAVREKFPDYELNGSVRWPNTELRREVDGLFHSLSSHRSIGGQYSHYFAVYAHLPALGQALSPFLAGGRNGYGYDIWNSFSQDLPRLVTGPNRLCGIQSTHQNRRGSEDIYRSCTENAEAHLAKHNRQLLKRVAPILLRCIEYALSDPTSLANGRKREFYRAKFDSFPISARELVSPPPGWGALTPEAIVLAATESFQPVQGLDAVARRLKALV